MKRKSISDATVRTAKNKEFAEVTEMMTRHENGLQVTVSKCYYPTSQAAIAGIRVDS